uniref:Uncharacterized protein n=2 Tax=Geoglobus ahangari TaxID=113653 RepID=A0A7C3UGT6_9EURY
MAKVLEKRSAKILAIILALIMIGSVFAYTLKETQTTPQREVIYEVRDFKEILDILPDAQYVYYLNFNLNDTNMSTLISNYWKSIVMNDPIFRYIRFSQVNSVFYAVLNQTIFGSEYLYLFDTGNSKIFFSYDQKTKYKDVTVKIKNGYGFAENINPAAIGTLNSVYDFIDRVSENATGSFSNLTSKLPSINYDFAVVLFGETANSSIKLENSTGKIADFYFEGIAVNESGGYDKVIAINFLQNVFFVESNVTEYYNVTRYGGFNIVFMHDHNFTKILEAKPEMRAVIIQWK